MFISQLQASDVYPLQLARVRFHSCFVLACNLLPYIGYSFKVSMGDSSLSHGWVNQCDQRGTIDIIWACYSTLFISLWVMLHLNVPASDDGWRTLFLRRLRWLLLGALAPETLLLSSGGQWTSAKRSRADMNSLGYRHWTMAHGFYADSGGFMLQSPGYRSFPVSARQVWYLAKERYIEVPVITEKEIFDKSKADLFTKTVACLQAGWFLAQCGARAIQHLSLSPLELATGAILLCTSTIYFFWLRKPLNVCTPTVLSTNHNIKEILLRAGDAAQDPGWNTPLDFAEPSIYTFDQWPALSSLCGPHRKPLDRVPNDRNPATLTFREWVGYGSVLVCFSTSSFLGWHFHFPTEQERLIWRTACIVAEASLFVHAIVEAIAHYKNWHDSLYVGGYKVRWPLGIFFFVPATTYFFARLLLLGVAISTLRSLPLDSYVNVRWSSFIPHI